MRMRGDYFRQRQQFSAAEYTSRAGSRTLQPALRASARACSQCVKMLAINWSLLSQCLPASCDVCESKNDAQDT